MVLLGGTDFWDSKQTTHLIEWKSSKIDRKVASTLAAEANGASQAYDRSMYVRALCAEIEQPVLRVLQSHGKRFVQKSPFAWEQIVNPCTTLALSQLPQQKRKELLWICLT